MRQPRNKIRTRKSVANDAQILHLHKAMATKLLNQPALVTNIRHVIEQRYQCGQLKHSGYIHWHSIFDCFEQPDLFRNSLLENSERMRKLRQRTVLVGVLTEEERVGLLSSEAMNTEFCNEVD